MNKNIKQLQKYNFFCHTVSQKNVLHAFHLKRVPYERMKGRMRKNFVGEKNSRSFSEFYLKFLENMYNLF